MTRDRSRSSRRDFLRLAAGTVVATGAAKVFPIEYQTPEASPQISPNDRIQIATIGMGGMGTANTMTALRVPGVELVAVADVYDGRLIRAQEVFGSGQSALSTERVQAMSAGASTVSTGKRPIFTTRDYREILSRPDVDAVIIATPDHWHAEMAIEAMKAGKDVYLEKPMIHDIEEGARIIEAQNRTGRICQIGSQRVSSIVYRKAKELIAQGAIGTITLIEAYWNRNTPIGAWQYTIPPDASPQNIDWDRFLGKAPKRPFDPVRLFRWRNYRDYGTGIPGDLFVHLFSGIHYVLDSLGPERILATGGLRYWKDGRDVPDVMLGIYDYPKAKTHDAFNLNLKVNFMDGGGGEEGFRFVGSEGTLIIGGNSVTLARSPKLREPGYTINTFPQAVQERFLKEYRAKYPESLSQEITARTTEVYAAPQGYSDHLDHHKNFFAAVRSRQSVIEDAVFGFRAAGPAVLSNTAYFERRIYRWDPERLKATPE
ncbi:Gfo/Idh/MocA family protein [Pyrinomonas methylaliphatogenes]|uniref:Predicted dehydrogenase n=1 Tax=Pyrinomonas methylaliphatogenes TaxID=454194 RepID=A0A0B6X0J7_9BACT|nr:Gfo/Idh/MocA family oxidoreductase [Pyrinomonas methylaliphatogenes]MBX5479177.1 Gfo/Idh/MocA family oxidoreductase [Pyrinomonas methylaliphatogenes]CDM67048.1 predicted dehydrogenase [Pyrinomonas methylaliphatogenes]